MRVNWITVLLEAVNFVVLVWILKRVLYARILDVIAQRRALVEKQLAEAAAEVEKARAEAKRATTLTAVVAKESDKALEVACAQAKVEGEKLHAAAQREAEVILESGRKRLTEEREEAGKKLEEAATSLSVILAERVLRELDPRAVTALLLERTIAQIESLPAARLTSLRAELRNGAVTVATATDVEASERAKIAKRLAERLNVSAESVTFAIEPSLVAGAEVRLPASQIAFTWSVALAELARGVAHEHAR